MLNQTVLVGKVIEISTLGGSNEITSAIVKVAVERSYLNQFEKRDEDILAVNLWAGIAEDVINLCVIGSIVGIRGRLEVKENKMIIIAEKVSFLSK